MGRSALFLPSISSISLSNENGSSRSSGSIERGWRKRFGLLRSLRCETCIKRESKATGTGPSPENLIKHHRKRILRRNKFNKKTFLDHLEFYYETEFTCENVSCPLLMKCNFLATCWKKNFFFLFLFPRRFFFSFIKHKTQIYIWRLA